MKTKLAESKTAKEANSYLSKGWRLIRCLLQSGRDGENARAAGTPDLISEIQTGDHLRKSNHLSQ